MVYRSRHAEAYRKKRMEGNLERSPTYSNMSERDREIVRLVYIEKRKHNELASELLEDYPKAIEEVAILYHCQKVAFQDVLTKEGFDPTEEVLRNYEGRIAGLTNNGTLFILGKLKDKGRYITMNRIHSQEHDYNGFRTFLIGNLKIRRSPIFTVGYHGSPLRALAINPHGADGDELEAKVAATLINRIDFETKNGYESYPGMDRLPIEIPEPLKVLQ